MRLFLLQCVVGAVWIAEAGLPTSARVVAGEGAPATCTVQDVQRWVSQLDSDSYAVREQATARLIEAGPDAIETLAPAVLSESAEVAWRSSIALQRIAVLGDEECVNRVAAALSKTKVERPAVTKIVQDIQAHQHKYRHNRAITKIRSLGGQLTGRWQDSMQAEPFAPAIVEEAPVDIEVAAPAPADPVLLEAIVRIFVPAEAPVAEPRAADAGPEIRPLSDIVPVAPVVEAKPVEAPPAGKIVAAEAAPLAPSAPLDIARIPTFEVPKLEEAPVEKVAALEAIPLIIDDEEPGIVAIDGGFLGPAVFLADVDAAPTEEDYAELVIDGRFKGTDADLTALRDIPELYSLSITDAKLTDKALDHVAALSHLTTLNLKGTPFTPAALRSLRTKRPSLSVICRSSAMLGINAGLEGACILTSVLRDSGAADAGLKDGDEVVEVDGQAIRDFSDLTISVYPHKPGDTLSVKYRRNGELSSVDVSLKTRVER